MAIFSISALFCGSNRPATASRRETGKKTGKLGDKKPVKLRSGISSKALLMSKMISWRKVEDDDEDEDKVLDRLDDDDDQAIWKKTIVKGEKCRPWDFSGKISYDSNGNLILES